MFKVWRRNFPPLQERKRTQRGSVSCSQSPGSRRLAAARPETLSSDCGPVCRPAPHFSAQETPARVTAHQGCLRLSQSLKTLAHDPPWQGPESQEQAPSPCATSNSQVPGLAELGLCCPQGSRPGPTTAGALSAGHPCYPWDSAHRGRVRGCRPGKGRGRFCVEQPELPA